jgi:putative phosphoribosyl transferase
MRLFKNRQEAAHELAGALDYVRSDKPVVLGLANGGVPLAEIIADELDAQFDVMLLDRLHAPAAPEHVVGAVDEHGRISMIQSTARWHHLTSQQMVEPAREAFRGLQRKRGKVRAILPELDVRDRTVIVVSQGVASGAKMLGAIASLRDRGANRIVAAAPAGTETASWQLHESADVVVIPHRPTQFKGIEHFYEDFQHVSDEELIATIERRIAARPEQQPGITTIVMKFSGSRNQLLCCEIDLPPGTKRGSGPYPAVIFSHGVDSHAGSPRNVAISKRLAKRGIVGVRMDFTGHGRSENTPDGATDQQMLEDLHFMVHNLTQLDEVDMDRVGLAGSGSGAMIALHYAAQRPAIRTMVIRGPVCGREVDASHKVRCPTLLIHAERDTALKDTIDCLNAELAATHELICIPNSNRLFSDPISLELMVNASVDWLVDHLTNIPPSQDRTPSETTRSAGESDDG